MAATEAATEAMIGHGTKIEIETVAGTGSYTELGEVRGAEKPKVKYDKVDATHMGSPGGIKESVSGLGDYDVITIPLSWVPGNPTDELIEAWGEGGNENRSVRITTPNNKVYTFPAHIDGYSGSIPVDGLMEAELALQPAGAVVRS